MEAQSAPKMEAHSDTKMEAHSAPKMEPHGGTKMEAQSWRFNAFIAKSCQKSNDSNSSLTKKMVGPKVDDYCISFFK